MTEVIFIPDEAKKVGELVGSARLFNEVWTKKKPS